MGSTSVNKGDEAGELAKNGLSATATCISFDAQSTRLASNSAREVKKCVFAVLDDDDDDQ